MSRENENKKEKKMNDEKKDFDLTDAEIDALIDKLEELSEEQLARMDEIGEAAIREVHKLEKRVEGTCLANLDKTGLQLEAERRMNELVVKHPECMPDMLEVALLGMTFTNKVFERLDTEGADKDVLLEINRLMELGEQRRANDVRCQMMERIGLLDEFMALEDRVLNTVAKYDSEIALALVNLNKQDARKE